MFKGLLDFRNQYITIRWVVVFPILIYIFIGLLALSSTSNFDSLISSTFYKQTIWVFLGIIIFMFVQYVRFQFLYDYSYVLYFFLFLLIFSTMFFPKIEGARRWIPIGPFYFQPSELGKIIYVFCHNAIINNPTNPSICSTRFRNSNALFLYYYSYAILVKL